MNIKKIISEVIKLPIKVGDTVYMGKFKNKKTVIKTIDWNDKGDLMINGKSALRVRIPKKAKKLKESNDFEWAKNWAEDSSDWSHYIPNVGDRFFFHNYNDFFHLIDDSVEIEVNGVDEKYVHWRIIDQEFLDDNREIFPIGEEEDGMSLKGFRINLKEGGLTPIS
jgi:hypothetical protein